MHEHDEDRNGVYCTIEKMIPGASDGIWADWFGEWQTGWPGFANAWC